MGDNALWTGLNPVSDEHDEIQKKTFTKWVNYHLETVSFKFNLSFFNFMTFNVAF